MKLGTDAWTKSAWYYSQLTLRKNGDAIEQMAAEAFSFEKRLPHYELFWKNHICPATQRPGVIHLRTNADEILSNISQRSYSTFFNIAEALIELENIQKHGVGDRCRNANISLMFAGNALVLYSELERVIAGPEDRFTLAIGTLAKRLGGAITPLSQSDKSAWSSLREDIVAYRHYLTHSGGLFTLHSSKTGKHLVLKRDKLRGTAPTPLSWTKIEKQHAGVEGDWHELVDACKQVIFDSLVLLDMGYEHLTKQLAIFLLNPAYQQLWGWTEGMAEMPNPAPATADGRSGYRPDVLSGIQPSADVFAAMSSPHPSSSGVMIK